MESDLDNDHILLSKGLSHAEAVALMAALEGSGISAILKTENLGGHVPGGVSNHIFVRKADRERAQEIIEMGKQETVMPIRKARAATRFVAYGYLALFGLSLLILVFFFGFHAGVSENSPKKTVAKFGKVDSNHDGVTETNVYANEDGGWVEETDHNGDGKADAVFEYAEDTGVPVRSREDSNLDGKFDSWTQYTSTGEKSRREEDRNFDGVVDAVFLFENGLPKSGVISDRGKVIDRTDFVQGHIVKTLVDTDRDGTLETEILFDELGVFKSAKKIL